MRQPKIWIYLNNFEHVLQVGSSYTDNNRAAESVNMERSQHGVCVEEVHRAGPFKVWNTADRCACAVTHYHHP